MELRQHQRDAIEKLKNGSVLNGGTGSGKTITSLAYYVEKVCNGKLDRSQEMETPRDLLVITTARKRDDLDWESEGIKLGLFRDPETSYGHKQFVVDSWNNIKKYVDLEGWFIIFDEQRLVGSGAWVKTFLKLVKPERDNKWILLSATPADTWMDYLPLFLAHGFYRTRTQFIDEHVIWSFHGNYRKIRGFFGVRRLERHRDEILVPMPYEKHTRRHVIPTYVDHDEEMMKQVWTKLWNVYEDRPLVDSAEKHRVARKVVNSDMSRLKKIEELSYEHPRMIIFYSFDYELELLRTLHTSLDIVVAEWNGHHHEPVPGTDKWLYLVQYTAGKEGWNCTETDTIVLFSGQYSHKAFEQALGRIDRLDTEYEDLYYFVLMSNSRIDKLIWRAISKKQNFHEGRNVRYTREE